MNQTHKMECLRCGTAMRYYAKECFQLGRTSLLLGDLPNLLSGGLEVDIYLCPSCGKMELYLAQGGEESEDALPQRRCPSCGTTHDFDYPKCPRCGHVY